MEYTSRENVVIRKLVWKALRRADPTALRKFLGDTLSYFELRAFFFSSEIRSFRLPSEAERVQGRRNRQEHKGLKRRAKKAREEKWMAKMGRKEQDPERRYQASRQNSVVDSGPGGRGGRESTISGEHGDSGSFDGGDYADEMAPGDTDNEEEERGDSEDGSGSYYRPIERLQCYACRERVRLSSSRCTACRSLNYACRDTGMCISPARYD